MSRYVGDSRVPNNITVRDDKACHGRIMATENFGRKVKVNCCSQFQAAPHDRDKTWEK